MARRLALVGRIFFALALIGLGVDHFIFDEFVTGRAPAWPESVPGKLVWAYVTGAVFVIAGIAILAGKHARVAALGAAALILLWALVRHIPLLIGSSFLSPEWTRAGKAAVFSGGSLAIAATLPMLARARRSVVERFVNLEGGFVVAARVCLGLFLIVSGIQHFMYTAFVASLIPRWFPGNAVVWTYFAGAALIAGGIGLLIPATALAAAFLSGLMIFSWFWIVHIPRTFVSVSDGIAVFEALGVAGILFAIAGYLSAQRWDRGWQGHRSKVRMPTAQPEAKPFSGAMGRHSSTR